MLNKTTNWHLSILVIVVSFLSIFLVQKYVLAQWNDPIGLPGETGGFRLVVNPLVEDLQLNSYKLIDDNFVLDSAGNTGLGTANPNYKLDVVGNVNATQLCIAGDCKPSWPNGYWEGVSGGIRYLNGYVGIGTSPHTGYRLSIADPGVTGTLKLDPGLVWAHQSDLDITSDYNTFLEGNVTIGSTEVEPVRRLHIVDTNNLWLRVDSGATGRTSQVEFHRGGTNDSTIGPSYNNTFDIWTEEDIPIIFGTNSDIAAILNNTGFFTTGYIKTGSYNAMPACDVGNYGAIAWENDCGSGTGCLQVCTEVGWKDIAVN